MWLHHKRLLGSVILLSALLGAPWVHAVNVSTRVEFQADSTTLTQEGISAVNSLLASAGGNTSPSLTLSIEAGSGDDANNAAQLAKQRTASVLDVLKTAGLTPESIRIIATESQGTILSGVSIALSDAPVPHEAPIAASAPEPSPPPPTAPFLTSTDKINNGDTAWMLTSTAFVLLMTIPGLALFYAGMVRKKNVLSTMMQSLAITCLVTLLWWVCGYSLAFTPGSPYLGGFDRLFMHGMQFIKETNQLSVSHLAPTIPETVYAMYQLTFAIITPALICGAFAERMKFSAMLWFMAAWSVLVYAPIAHWVWEPTGWLAALGALDFAGGTVVHINAGIAALACVVVLGPRRGYGEEPMPPHNLTLTILGAALLWVGWFGFNAGSAVAADGRAGMAMLATQMATAAAALSWMTVEWTLRGTPSVLGVATGAVAGLVAITPASGFVGPGEAIIIGAAGGVVCYFAATTGKRLLGLDDSLDAFAVHCVGGIVGAVLTGVYASKEISGVTGNLVSQLIAIGATLVYGFVVSWIILKILDWAIGLRVTQPQEEEGLDVTLHGEQVE